jgi:hypothetical protein
VEIDPDDLPEDGIVVQRGKVYAALGAGRRAYPHSKVVSRDGKQYIHLITSRKAIFSSWGEYALDRAKREKEAEIQKAKYDRLRNAQATLMGFDGAPDFWDWQSSRARFGYLNAGYQKIRKADHGQKGEDIEVGQIELTIDQAERIIEILTPEQKSALTIAALTIAALTRGSE